VAILVEGSFDADVSDGLEAVFLTAGVFVAGGPIEVLVRGVPSIVDRGTLNVLLEARKLGSSVPALEPGRLPAREGILLGLSLV
jgi:hypothetical protein